MRVDLWKKMHRTECRTPLFWSFLDCLVLNAFLLFRFRLYMPSFAVYTNGMLTNVLSFAFTSIFNHTAAGHPKYTIRDAILTCARKPTWVSLIYRTEPTTKKCKNRKNTKVEDRYDSVYPVGSDAVATSRSSALRPFAILVGFVGRVYAVLVKIRHE